MPHFINIDIHKYDSPLDLIYDLIERNKIDIYDIPIFDITQQYLSVLKMQAFHALNMELASEFLLMAATLIQIKSRMLLPDIQEESTDLKVNDPREELVLRLLAYRRNKYLAKQLEDRLKKYEGTYLKTCSLPQDLDLTLEIIEDKLDEDKLQKAVEQLEKRNQLRFNSQNQRIKQLLKREKFSVKEKMREVLNRVFKKTRLFFSELFPPAQTSKAERISGFLAVLELIRQDKIIVKQAEPFSVILIEPEQKANPLPLPKNRSGQGRDVESETLGSRDI